MQCIEFILQLVASEVRTDQKRGQYISIQWTVNLCCSTVLLCRIKIVETPTCFGTCKSAYIVPLPTKENSYCCKYYWLREESKRRHARVVIATCKGFGWIRIRNAWLQRRQRRGATSSTNVSSLFVWRKIQWLREYSEIMHYWVSSSLQKHVWSHG